MKYPERPPRREDPPRGVRRALSNVGGEVETAGDGSAAEALARALAVPDDPEASREHVHGFHSYPARLHPHTARTAIEAFCSPGGVVLDPFCGSGTVLVEARLAGRRAWGVDANPLAVRLSELKATGRDEARLDEILAASRQVASVADERRKARRGSSRRYPEADRQAFDPHVLLELDGLRVGIEALDRPAVRRDLELVLSSILTKVGRKVADSSDEFAPKRIAAGYPAKLFTRKADELARRVREYSALLPEAAPKPVVVEDDARRLNKLVLPPVSLVVTSPPYPGNYDYLYHHEARLRWLGLDAKTFDGREVGARRHLESLPFSKAIARWYDDLVACLDGIARALAADGRALVVIADSVVGTHPIDNELTVREAGDHAGLVVIARASQRRPHFHAGSRDAFQGRGRREHAILLGHARAKARAKSR